MSRVVDVALDHPAFDGHFPGQPVWPGVMLLAEVYEALRADTERAARLGALPRLASAKFLAPVRPGDQLEIGFSDTSRGARFEVRRGETVAASGELLAEAA